VAVAGTGNKQPDDGEHHADADGHADR